MERDTILPSKRTLLIVFVVLLVTLAGCSGGPGDDGGDSDSDGTETDDGGPDDQAMSALGGSGEEVMQAHQAALEDQETFTVVVNTTLSNFDVGTGQAAGSDSGTIDGLFEVDSTTGETYGVMTIGSTQGTMTIEQYSPPNEEVSYTRMEMGGQPFYSRTETGGVMQNASMPGDASFFDAVEFESEGTVTRDGRTLEKYVVTGTDQVAEESVFGGTVSDITMTVFVDQSTGLLSEVDWEYTYEGPDGQQADSEMRFRYEAVGSTTVTQPDWLEEAKSQADETQVPTDGTEFDTGGEEFQTPEMGG
jgi:hypothetical protein